MTRIILGIDPGSIKTGWGVVEFERGHIKFIESGIINLGSGEMCERLLTLHTELSKLTKRIRPTEVAIEEVFLAKNFKSALKLGQARGVAMLAAGIAGVSLREFAAKTVKQAICGQGQATKYQMQNMVMRLLELPENPGEDAADALGIALCAAYIREGVGADARFRLPSRCRAGSRWRLRDPVK